MSNNEIQKFWNNNGFFFIIKNSWNNYVITFEQTRTVTCKIVLVFKCIICYLWHKVYFVMAHKIFNFYWNPKKTLWYWKYDVMIHLCIDHHTPNAFLLLRRLVKTQNISNSLESSAWGEGCDSRDSTEQRMFRPCRVINRCRTAKSVKTFQAHDDVAQTLDKSYFRIEIHERAFSEVARIIPTCPSIVISVVTSTTASSWLVCFVYNSTNIYYMVTEVHRTRAFRFSLQAGSSSTLSAGTVRRVFGPLSEGRIGKTRPRQDTISSRTAHNRWSCKTVSSRTRPRACECASSSLRRVHSCNSGRSAAAAAAAVWIPGTAAGCLGYKLPWSHQGR